MPETRSKAKTAGWLVALVAAAAAGFAALSEYLSPSETDDAPAAEEPAEPGDAGSDG